MNRLESTKIQKEQVQGASAIKSIDKPPPKSEMANWNDFTFALDEVNSKLYIKGKKKSFYLTLTEY